MNNIIPKVHNYKEKNGYFILDKFTKIVIEKEAQIKFSVCEIFSNTVKKATGYDLEICENSGKNHINLKRDKELSDDAYKIIVEEEIVTILANDEKTFFYGFQTLLQLLPVEIFSDEIIECNWKIDCAEIYDKSKYSWRGMHLDVSRHFFPVYFIKKYLDLMALHKLNKFHWHLTDDNGWRIEIKKYPKLTDICAWRKNLEHLEWNSRASANDSGNGIYGGYYTQKDIKEIIDYANDRFIEVIPEIEMPGHSSEIFAAFPHLSCRGEITEVAPGGYWPNYELFCAGNEETFEFIEDILAEIIELFPSNYIHIGGDEANKTRWKDCPKCQKRIVDENLKNENELQSYFIHRIQKFVENNGKKIIGWDEIIDGGISKDVTVMCWRGDGKDSTKIAIKNGSDVILCPNPILYFDWRQKAKTHGAFGVTTIEKVYNYNPEISELKDEEKKHILGVQGNVWTEFMPTIKDVEYMTIPRICALAEVGWSDSERNFEDFEKRLVVHKERLSKLNYNYFNE